MGAPHGEHGGAEHLSLREYPSGRACYPAYATRSWRVAGSFSLPAAVARGETGQFTGYNGLVCLRGLGGLQRSPSSEKLTANTATAGSSANVAGGSSDHWPDTAGFSNFQRFPARH